MGKPVILIVEDNAVIQMVYADLIGDRAEILPARDTDSARELIEAHARRITAAIIDGQVPDRTGEIRPSSQPTTIPLVRLLREKGSPAAVIVAVSYEPRWLPDFVEAGCNLGLAKDRLQAVELFELLGLSLGK